MRHPTRWLLVLVVVLGCSEPFAPAGPAVAFEPPTEWRHLHTQVEMCSGLIGDYDRITWFRVSGPNVDGRHPAVWVAPHSIYLADPFFDYDAVARSWLVRHEMLHDLIGGDPTHSSPVWNACQV